MTHTLEESYPFALLKSMYEDNLCGYDLKVCDQNGQRMTIINNFGVFTIEMKSVNISVQYRGKGRVQAKEVGL